MKYQLRKGDTAFAIGQTNFSESKGSLIDTNGCNSIVGYFWICDSYYQFQKKYPSQGRFYFAILRQ